jgi:hypothetical protein
MRFRPSEATRLDTLDDGQLRDLLSVVANPRHKMIQSRVALFRRLGILVPVEPRRPPTENWSRRAPPGRAHAVTEIGLGVLQRRGLLQPQAAEVSS